MAALKPDVKAFIIQSLACYDTPSQVVEAVQKEFGINITRQQAESHDPTKASGKTLAKKWGELFNATRERFQNEISDIPIANKAYRLRVLDRMATKAEGMKNMALTAALMEQAAKEVGDAYTNKQKVEQIVVATHNVMPVPSCDNVNEWEAAAQKQQSEVLGG
ncbi:DUF2280 domain-containing protein [Citrobacter freundii]|uniref:DUF2280 domain-containing protein n=1 Tax=Citrobacter freundii complex TaxID=1344959 RepID=UPI0002D7E0B2|nr:MULTISPECIES: DUF2280 domain-containing protein [Citrobacter freundii complex]EJD6422014.1 DUF2280 domain-containing protein [Citrobacter freundii]EJD6625289.1 DUF2280 domain-containing protein [Citrobacter freundii]MDH1755582.1 DUF2280 domain-containing protein [Citrobacter braakii]MDH1853705.1 DUF2280 domain-containing protein [Citrobacter braakii]WFV10624.1 DUF2280 domain-containing protein [Citrobacter freundii]